MTRRSTRLRAQIPILITSLDPAITVSLLCETLVVNAHGCAARVPQPLAIGMPVRLQIRDSEATGRVVVGRPIGGGQSDWLVGIELDQPANIWGLKRVPEDWTPFDGSGPQSGAREPAVPASQLKMSTWPAGSPSGGTTLVARTAQEELDKKLAKQQEAIANLQDRLASLEAASEGIRDRLENGHQQILTHVRQQLDGSLAEFAQPLHEEVAVCRKDVQQIRAAAAGRFEQLPGQIEQHVQALFQPLLEQARTELERIITNSRSQDAQNNLRPQIQASAEASQKELAQARLTLESSVENLHERIRAPIAAAVADALARARAELSSEVARELETLHERGRMLADELRSAAELLRSEREATRAQTAEASTQREELRNWLQEQQAACIQEIGRRLEQLTNELESRTAERLEQRFRATEVKIQAGRAEADLNQSLTPMLDRITDLRQEVLSLLNPLEQESARCQTEVRTLIEQKNEVEARIRERTGDFQKLLHDALLETTGQIKGRLQMALEMVEQPVEKLRDQVMQQLQEQAGMQARLLRENLDEAGERLSSLQRRIEGAVAEALRAQAAETSAAFGREIAQVAQRSVEEWRSALARNLESLTNSLGQKLPGGDK